MWWQCKAMCGMCRECIYLLISIHTKLMSCIPTCSLEVLYHCHGVYIYWLFRYSPYTCPFCSFFFFFLFNYMIGLSENKVVLCSCLDSSFSSYLMVTVAQHCMSRWTCSGHCLQRAPEKPCLNDVSEVGTVRKIGLSVVILLALAMLLPFWDGLAEELGIGPTAPLLWTYIKVFLAYLQSVYHFD